MENPEFASLRLINSDGSEIPVASLMINSDAFSERAEIRFFPPQCFSIDHDMPIRIYGAGLLFEGNVEAVEAVTYRNFDGVIGITAIRNLANFRNTLADQAFPTEGSMAIARAAALTQWGNIHPSDEDYEEYLRDLIREAERPRAVIHTTPLTPMEILRREEALMDADAAPQDNGLPLDEAMTIAQAAMHAQLTSAISVDEAYERLADSFREFNEQIRNSFLTPPVLTTPPDTPEEQNDQPTLPDWLDNWFSQTDDTADAIRNAGILFKDLFGDCEEIGEYITIPSKFKSNVEYHVPIDGRSVQLWKDQRQVTTYCIEIPGTPAVDQVIARVLFLMHDEATFLAKANDLNEDPIERVYQAMECRTPIYAAGDFCQDRSDESS